MVTKPASHEQRLVDGVRRGLDYSSIWNDIISATSCGLASGSESKIADQLEVGEQLAPTRGCAAVSAS